MPINLLEDNNNNINLLPDLEGNRIENNIPKSEKKVKTFLGEMSRPKPFNEQQANEQLRKILDVYGFMGPGSLLKAPQFIANAVSKLPRTMQGLTNAAGRIGTGTGLTTGSEYFSPENKENLGDITSRNALLNTALEAGTLPFRIPAHIAEIFNPLKYGAKKSNQIKNEFSATKATTDEMYRPINEKYNDTLVTLTPKKYLEDAGIRRNPLHPDAKIVFDDFIKDPSYKNLQAFQSKMGNEWARTTGKPSSKAKSELFKQMRDALKTKTEKFLERDPEALRQYKLATDYARDNYYPYLSTPSLRKIAKGKLDLEPNKLAKSIKQGTEKTIGEEERLLIPKGHPLHNHLKDLNSVLNFGNAAQFGLPAIGGGIMGELMHPGLGGIVGGGISGIGSSGLSKIASKFGAPSMTNFMQNPKIENIFNKTEPAYYGAGRTAINQ